ncbi:MAG: hypothetical protein Q9159_003497 [Coniocarpon cinnabarinum]
MAWDHLSINKPHLVYIILGGFTSLFMLCSSIIKEKFYIGEATVATICGLIFGPHAADLIDPMTWGNTDQITLEFSRIVLVVQCFAVGVELPKAYMERHWRSVVFLLVPVMTFGWLVTSLFIWAVFHDHLNWLDSLTIAACVTATDPVLASSVVGKGKFAKRVPKHLRDLLSAESGCNDGMAFPFVYLALYLVHYRPNSNEVALNWICVTILYECVFGAFYGVMVGYAARRAVRYAHEQNYIDRESFLVFYFVLALFCAGSGSMLGMDDLLIGFACGVGFSNDGWFTEKTEESHVSNVIDLLINLAFFVYFGTIIPWDQFNSSILHIEVWKLVVIAILVLFFRRIPIMMALKPVIPDIKTWREALFAGHFGPIGVGAIFVAILARAELETHGTTPLAVLPPPDFEHANIIEMIWPITTFLVLTSIIVHGSSIAVFTLGKHINTLTITMSYTQANEDSANWMDRLPRIQSRSKSSMSKADSSDISLEDEKMADDPEALPHNFLRRQKIEDTPRSYRPSSRKRRSRASWRGAGGPIDPSAIDPRPREEPPSELPSPSEKSELAILGQQSSTDSPESSDEAKASSPEKEEPEEEVYQEGNDTVIEDEQGNVLEVMHSKKDEAPEQRRDEVEGEVRRLMGSEDVHHGVSRREEQLPDQKLHDAVERAGENVKEAGAAALGKHAPQGRKQGMKHRMASWAGHKRTETAEPSRASTPPPAERDRKHGPARAFRFGRTIIVEDEDGEVIKKFDIPQPERDTLERRQSYVDPEKTKQRLQRMGKMLGVGHHVHDEEPGASSKTRARQADEEDDAKIRFTVDGNARRMSKAEFIQQIQGMNPKERERLVENSDAPETVKQEAREDAAEHTAHAENLGTSDKAGHGERLASAKDHSGGADAQIEKVQSSGERPGLTLRGSSYGEIPFHSVSTDIQKDAAARPHETAAQRRRRLANSSEIDGEPSSRAFPNTVEEDSDDDGTERVPPSQRRHMQNQARPHGYADRTTSSRDVGETAAERRRREGALGLVTQEEDSDEDEGRPRQPPRHTTTTASSASDSPRSPQARGIRFADEEPRGRSGASIRWKT